MDAVRAMLTSLRLDSYADAFEDAGYDDLEFIATGVDNVKLLEEIGSCVNMKPGQCALCSNPLRYCSRLTRPAPSSLSQPAEAHLTASRLHHLAAQRGVRRRRRRKRMRSMYRRFGYDMQYNMGGLGREGR